MTKSKAPTLSRAKKGVHRNPYTSGLPEKLRDAWKMNMVVTIHTTDTATHSTVRNIVSQVAKQMNLIGHTKLDRDAGRILAWMEKE